MPLTEKGAKILKRMLKAYGKRKGKAVFYAAENKGTITGVHGGGGGSGGPFRVPEKKKEKKGG